MPPECHHRDPAEDGQLADPVQNLLSPTQNRLHQEGNHTGNFFLELDQSFGTDPVLYIRAVLTRRRVHRRRQRHGADQRWGQRHADRKARGARVLHAEHLRNPPETSPRLSRIHAEHLRNPTKTYADSNRNQTKSMQNLTETNPNPTKSNADSNRNQTKPMQNLTETNPNPCKIHTLSIRNPKPWRIYQIHIMTPAIRFQKIAIGMLTPKFVKIILLFRGGFPIRQPTSILLPKLWFGLKIMTGTAVFGYLPGAHPYWTQRSFKTNNFT